MVFAKKVPQREAGARRRVVVAMAIRALDSMVKKLRNRTIVSVIDAVLLLRARMSWAMMANHVRAAITTRNILLFIF